MKRRRFVCTKEDLIKDVLRVSNECKKRKTYITRNDYRFKGKFSENQISRYFRNFTNMLKELNIISSVNEKSSKKEKINRDNIKPNKNIKGEQKKKYFVSSIVCGAKVDENFLKAINLFCKKEKAKLILLVMRGVKIKDCFSNEDLERFRDNLFTEFHFNRKLSAFDFKLNPQQIVSLTGLDRYGQKESSLIIAHTKQMYRSIPRGKKRFPHTMFSTGTISIPKYTGTRLGRIATQDNLLGGLIVEVQDNKYFNVRQTQFKGGRFIDLGIGYYAHKVAKEKTEAIVMGDLHIGSQNDISLKAGKEIIKKLNPKKIILHDLIDFLSISHHIEGNLYEKNKRPAHQRTLQAELDYFCKWFIEWNAENNANNKRRICGDYPEIIAVKSNHDEFLTRYLQSGRFISDIPENAKLGAKLLIQWLDGINPIEYYIKDKIKKNIKFLKRDEKLSICGIECGQHGDKGINGARSSGVISAEKSYGACVIGHTHSPAILREAYAVGTNSKLDMGYNQGGSSWIPANVVIYANGGRQLITIIDGKW